MIKINSLEIENIKRVKAVKLQPSENGLTIIGGNNGQGKTSVLDAIAWALGGDKYKPSDAQREGSVVPPSLSLKLNNGLIVERKGANSSLKVIDAEGNKSGQQLLNGFIEQLALDLPKFINSNSKEKANILLKIIGVGDRLYSLEQEEAKLYNQRHEIGQIADQKEKYAKEMIVYPDAPKELISASELIRTQQEILAKNGENQRKREQAEFYNRRLLEAQKAYDEAKKVLQEAEQNAEIANKSAFDLQDESTEKLEQNIIDIDNLNVKIRANMDKEKAEIDADNYRAKYNDLTEQIDSIRQEKINLLKSANLPLEGLTVDNAELLYNGKKWDCMSSSEQLKVATAIVRKINPKCGFVLMDKLEQMDKETLKEFGHWLERENLQVIATRVSSGDECSIIIEDGYSREPINQPMWKKGEF